MNVKLWVDDLRIPPDDTFDVARTFNDAIQALMAVEYEEIYLDHDLSSWDDVGRERTGAHIVDWLAEQSMTVPGFAAPKRFYILSDNGPGIRTMRLTIERYFGPVQPWIKPSNLKSIADVEHSR
jgi:hypothetical protein